MRRIADLVQSGDEFIHFALLQPNTQVHLMLSGSRAMEFPAIRDLDPLMLDGEIIPSFRERLRDSQLGKTQYEDS